MTAGKIDESILGMFMGAENYYRHGPYGQNLLITEGVKYVADAGGAYWLLDEIAFAQADESVRVEEFQAWMLKVAPDQTAVLTCDDGNGNIVFTKAIPFTDFPRDEISLWFANDTIYLPREH